LQEPRKQGSIKSIWKERKRKNENKNIIINIRIINQFILSLFDSKRKESDDRKFKKCRKRKMHTDNPEQIIGKIGIWPVQEK
jgi:hypothetical protein